MIKMYVSKNEEGHILMGKPKSAVGPIDNDSLWVEDVVKIAFMQTQQGLAPIPCYFPNMIVKDIVKKDFLNKMDVLIKVSDYVVVDEEDIVSEMLEFYRIEMGKRSGIELVPSLPNGLKLVR